MWEEFEGVVELTERQRCKDPYWNEVTDELRAGQLSEKNWCYLNGKPVKGCTLSEEERQSRRRVITGPNDPRLQEDRFKEAPAIVGTNDAKYQINMQGPCAEIRQGHRCPAALVPGKRCGIQ